jgi:rod shape-determining protein MreD
VRDTPARDILAAFLATLVAVLIYSVAGASAPALLIVFDAFAAVVLYFSVRRGEIFGAVLGTMCGLVQDAFSLGVFGVAGLTKTLLGFWSGYVSRRIDVAPLARNALFLLIMAVAESALWLLLTAVVRPGSASLHGGLFALRPAVTAVLGTILFAFDKWSRARGSRAA